MQGRKDSHPHIGMYMCQQVGPLKKEEDAALSLMMVLMLQITAFLPIPIPIPIPPIPASASASAPAPSYDPPLVGIKDHRRRKGEGEGN